ncbi:MAG: HAMP domain-containing protein [Ktedonobacteraceae bacterium]|nr:HAMP domain-containing protein [Ktedonobacteraceae bacterium]
MFKLLNNMSIFRRLFIIFALATIIPVIVILVLGTFFLGELNTRSQAVTASSNAQSLAAQEQDNLLRMNALLGELNNNTFAIASGAVNDASLSASGALISSEITSREIDFQNTLQNYDINDEIRSSPNMITVRTIIQNDSPTITDAVGNKINLIQDQGNKLDSVIDKNWPLYQKLQDNVLNQINALRKNLPAKADITAQYEKIYATLYQANNAFTPLEENWQRVVDDATTMEGTVTQVGQSQTNATFIATGIAIASILLIIFITALVVNLTITQRLRRLASLTRRFTTGDTSVRADILGRDEIMMVATSMNLMLDNIVNLIHAAERQRDILQAQVEKLLREVSGVGEGDLRVQADVTAGTLGALADSFNYMIEELSNLVIRVKQVAAEVENGTALTLERMTQLVTSADTQISQIKQATTEVEQMAYSSRQVAERAEALYNSALGARQTAQTGRHSVQLSVEGIGRIQEYVQNTSSKVQILGERSRTINNVADVISNIAHQTNRLSLDAAIQAAMAGESGKGFRAVADDIRRLAEDAKNQTHSITQMVRSVRDDINALATSMKDTERETLAGTNLAQQTGLSLDAIFGVVEQQAQEIAIINQAARQQSQSSNTVVQIMQDVSASTLQNTSSTHAVEQSMERLARLAQQLQTSVGAFKLRNAREDRTGFVGEQKVEGTFQIGNGYRLPHDSRSLTTYTETAQSVGTGRYPDVLAPKGDSAAYPAYPPVPQSQRRDNGQRSYSPSFDQNSNSTQRR